MQAPRRQQLASNVGAAFFRDCKILLEFLIVKENKIELSY